MFRLSCGYLCISGNQILVVRRTLCVSFFDSFRNSKVRVVTRVVKAEFLKAVREAVA